MNKKIKHYILIVIGIAAVLFGLSRLNIQSVSEYEHEGEELTRQLQLEAPETTAPDGTSTSGTAVLPSVSATAMPAQPRKTEAAQPEKTEAAQPRKTEEAQPKKTEAAQTEKPDAARTKTDKAKAVKGAVKTKKPAGSSDASAKTSEAPAKTSPTATKTPETNTITCTVEIRADSLNQIRDTLSPSVLSYLPENGVILAKTKVTLKKNTTVYQALEQVCRAKKIAVDAAFTPVYESYYVKGIGHLYEQDAGDMSGWLYLVNGKIPDVGASAYTLTDGDELLWGYTCDGRTV
jgi:outer membrane biosynthesis protein TonB